MLKLLTLEGFLSLSAEAVKKISAVLEDAGLEGTEKFDEIDEFVNEAVSCIADGTSVVLAAEVEEYITVKKAVIDAFSLDSTDSDEVRDVLQPSKAGRASKEETDGQCLMPSDAEVYLTPDGKYSGFCVEFSNGARLVYLSLDEKRLEVLLGFIKNEFCYSENENEQEEEASEDENSEDEASEDETSTDIFAAVLNEEAKGDDENEAEMPQINDALPPEETFTKADAQESSAESEGEDDKAEDEEESESNSMLTLRSGEELIIDDSADEADLTGFESAMEAAAKTAFTLINLDKTAAFVGSDLSPFMLAMSSEVDGLADTFKVCDVELENEDELEIQVALAKKARLAMRDTGAQFAAAISPVMQTEKDGKELYYSYIIIHDGTSAKAKKVSTATQQGLESLIPHAFRNMFQLIERKAESMAMLESDEFADDDSDRKKKIAILSVSVACAALAILCAVLMVWKYFQRTPEVLTTDPLETQSTQPTTESTSAPSTQPITIPGLPGDDSQFPYPAEPTATDVTNIPTSVPFASTKGTFTFTVYGYGHGVGMSQNGANYYAGIGKSYLEILAMYYYGATLVLGDTMPETVMFGGTQFTLRDYVATAVESEMGSSFNPEALKAQAVAIYTFAKFYNFDVPATLHAFNKQPSEAAYAATDIVLGQYMTYNGEVIRPYFHSTSAGKTASYNNVFGDAQLPYLAGGRPSYGDVNATDYCTTVTYTSDDLKALIYSKTNVMLDGDPANWIKILSHDACINANTGYISKIQVGDKVYSGYDFRMKVLGGAIRSHCFTFTYTPMG